MPDTALTTHVFYLHGFASSARSSKAAFLAEKLATRGIPLVTPDFNEPAFETLTVSRMVEQVLAALRPLPPADRVVLVGSSLGAYVALLVNQRRPVSHLVLLAPAIEFSAERLAQIGDRPVDEWRRTGVTHVFHYGFGRVLPLGFAIYDDVAAQPNPPAPDVPTLVFQGRRDGVVDPAGVERWARTRPDTVRLVLLEDDHQLAGSLEVIWRALAPLV